MNVYSIVEDDLDLRGLVRMMFRRDAEFVISVETESAEEALELLRKSKDVGLIVLDHGLTGALTGLEAAPLFKEVVPQAKIILFTADPNLKSKAAAERAVDAFLIKTDISQLVTTARRICHMGSSAA